MSLSKREPEKEIRRHGRIATLRWAKSRKTCTVCILPIPTQTRYYQIVIAGGGVGSLKFPDTTHIECIGAYFRKYEKYG